MRCWTSFGHGDGSAASPLLHGDLLIVNAVVETAEAFRQGETVALDPKTGKEVWREMVGGYVSSPLVTTVGGKTELVVPTFRGPWLGLDPLTGAPAPVDEAQLRELGVQARPAATPRVG